MPISPTRNSFPGDEDLFLYPIFLEPESLAHYAHELGLGQAEAIRGMAEAIASHHAWPSSVDALVVRSGARPALAVLGPIDPPSQIWLECQARALDAACRSLRYVGYSQVHRDCELLATKLREILNPDELVQARFTAIPRGGLIVLGLLSTILGLDPAQISASSDSPLLIVVDDCALSGARFKKFLDRCTSDRVVFAPLYSHPDLRAAIKARESRVVDCISAVDLCDLSPADLSAEHRERRQARLKEGRYWIGSPEALCFPWNEPDRTFWNPESKKHERTWRIVPPELCLKNRPTPKTRTVPIQEQPPGKGPLRPSERILFGESRGEIVLCDPETRQTFRFAGIGSNLWRAIVRQGSLEKALEELRQEYDVPEETLREDAHRFAESVIARGFLEVGSPGTELEFAL